MRGVNHPKMIRTIAVIEAILILALLIVLCFFLYNTYAPVKERTNSHWAPEPGFVPEMGFVSDARTAEAIGRAVIDSITGEKSVSRANVSFDEEHQAWIVSKSYLGHPGGEVYIDQQTGKIIKFLYFK